MKSLILVVYGYLYWNFLKLRYSINKTQLCIICPYGIGDTYFICALAKQVLNKKRFNSIILLLKNSHLGIVQLFSEDVKRAIAIGRVEMRALSEFSRYNKDNLLLGHPNRLSQGEILKVLGYKNINLIDLYKIFVLDIPVDSPMTAPKSNFNKISEIESVFKQKCLPKGRTAILAPDAVSINAIPVEFWNILTSELYKNGWSVCTNVISDDVQPVANTVALNFPLELAKEYIEYAGWFISIRSGLCDLVSSAKSKLTIIYPKQNWYAGSVLSSASLKEMGLSNNVKEYEFGSDDNFINIVQKIIQDQSRI